MAYPSHIARNALRTALRNHPDVATVTSRTVNSLTIGELNAMLRTLGQDPDAIARAALNPLYHPTSAPTPDTLDKPIHPATVLNAKDEGMAAFDNGHDVTDNPYLDATLRGAWLEGWTSKQCEPLPEPEPNEDPHGDAAAIEAEMQSIRGLIATGGFSAFDDKLRTLVIEARKPAEVIRVEVPTDGGTAIAHASKPTGKHATWNKLFGIQGPLGKRETALWDGMHPHTPAIDDRYVWPACTAAILTQIARGKNIMLFGPAGTGKTQFMAQLAARTGRPYALISCDNGTEAAALKGMTVPDASGGVTWQDGQLTRAIKTPGCIICLDEPSVARSGALFVLQNVLEDRKLFLDETGERVTVAPSVIFSATDNTNGTGGGSRKGYTDTNRLNHAFLDRLSVRVKFDYMAPDSEARVIVAKTGCTSELARLLVSAATVTRAAANDATLSHGIGLRRLFAWAELLTDGIAAADAFEMAILNCAAEQDVEALREQCLLAYDAANVKRALEAQGGTI